MPLLYLYVGCLEEVLAPFGGKAAKASTAPLSSRLAGQENKRTT